MDPSRGSLHGFGSVFEGLACRTSSTRRVATISRKPGTGSRTGRIMTAVWFGAAIFVSGLERERFGEMDRPKTTDSWQSTSVFRIDDFHDTEAGGSIQTAAPPDGRFCALHSGLDGGVLCRCRISPRCPGGERCVSFRKPVQTDGRRISCWIPRG